MAFKDLFNKFMNASDEDDYEDVVEESVPEAFEPQPYIATRESDYESTQEEPTGIPMTLTE